MLLAAVSFHVQAKRVLNVQASSNASRILHVRSLSLSSVEAAWLMQTQLVPFHVHQESRTLVHQESHVMLTLNVNALCRWQRLPRTRNRQSLPLISLQRCQQAILQITPAVSLRRGLRPIRRKNRPGLQ